MFTLVGETDNGWVKVGTHGVGPQIVIPIALNRPVLPPEHDPTRVMYKQVTLLNS